MGGTIPAHERDVRTRAESRRFGETLAMLGLLHECDQDEGSAGGKDLPPRPRGQSTLLVHGAAGGEAA